MRPCTACISRSRLHALRSSLEGSGTLARQCGKLARTRDTRWPSARSLEGIIRSAILCVLFAGLWQARKLCQGKRARALALTQSACGLKECLQIGVAL